MPNATQSSPTSDKLNTDSNRELRVFIVAGEHSGDALGGKLMRAISATSEATIRYRGVGGETMHHAGLNSLFPLHDVAVMGPISILKALPRIARRIYQTIDAAIEFNPDIVVIIDSPEFTHPIAKRIRKRAPSIPIIDYVSPSIWAWRPGRAKKMKPYVDHVLALLPFEPAAHVKHGGPPCTYVGHPLAERLPWMRALETKGFIQNLGLSSNIAILTALPGSRASEIRRFAKPFGEALEILQQRGNEFQVIVPVVKKLRPLVLEHTKSWPLKPTFVESDNHKFRAFKTSKAALAVSGTVTLELAMIGTPTIVAYKVEQIVTLFRSMLKVPSIVLANLVLGKNVYPEYVQERCTPQELADALELLLKDTPERRAQIAELKNIDRKMKFEGASPSELAAKIVLSYAKKP